MWYSLKTLIKRLTAVLGAVVILLAIALGGFRLLASQLPSYQQEIQQWLAADLGLQLGFDRIDMRLGLGGPEVIFHDVVIAQDDPGEPFAFASEATVTLDPVALIADRRSAVRRLVLEGIRLTLVRTVDDTWRIGGGPDYRAVERDFGFEIPREVELVVRGSEILYQDELLDVEWQFRNVTVEVDQDPGSISMVAQANPPQSLGSRIQLAVDGVLDKTAPLSDDWSGLLSIRDADLAELGRLMPERYRGSLGGNGDVSVWLDLSAGEFDRVMADIALRDLILPSPSEAGAPLARSAFERISLTAEWSRVRTGWQLALDDVEIRRQEREWIRGGNSLVRSTNGGSVLTVQSDYLRLEDLTPVIDWLPSVAIQEEWRALQPSGEIRDLMLAVDATAAEPDYEVMASFTDVGVAARAPYPGVAGISGEIRADARSGTLALRSETSELDMIGLFDQPLEVGTLNGIVVWRRGQNGLRVVTDDLSFRVFGAEVGSSMELTIPRDDGAPLIDLVSRIGRFEAISAKPYIKDLPLPSSVIRWIDRAIVGGTVDALELNLFGPIDALPFDNGEGRLHLIAEVSDGYLDYVDQWPAAEDLNGRIEVVNARFAGTGRGRVLGNQSDNVEVVFEDLRDPVLQLIADTTGPLGDFLQFLNDAPQIARYLGPSYKRLSAPSGIAELSFDLIVPLADIPRFALTADLNIVGGELAVEGFPPHARDIDGMLMLRDGVVSGQGITATFLDGPVVAEVGAAERDGYRARLDVEGEVTADSVLAAFNLSHRELFAGQTIWQGSLSLPSHDREPAQPVLVTASSNLSGVALKFPEPFGKAPADPTSLHLEFEFGVDGSLDVEGNLGAARRFAAAYAHNGVRFDFVRGSLAFGGAFPALLSEQGLFISGEMAALDLNEWLKLSNQTKTRIASAYDYLAGVDIAVAGLSMFGQELGASHLVLRRLEPGLQFDIDSEPIAGRITLPRNMSDRPIVTASMSRLQLETGRALGLDPVDPRKLPSLSLAADDVTIGQRRLGRVSAELQADPLGLRLTSFENATEHYSANGSGAWFDGVDGAETRLAFHLNAVDVAGALEQLGFDRLLEGDGAELTASLYWPGSPAADWMAHLGGDIGLRIEDGAILDIDPGAGRLVGLMSIMALPRRLLLDFRDVFNKGFAFDEIGGDFVIVDGDAFTDNLKLSGPAAEIGVVGRTGLRDRDFHQQAVITAEPGNMLPTVGGLLGGAGVGAALLLFTRIFKEPLKGIGRASYCITGHWDAPQVERLTQEQLNQDQLCAELPPESGQPLSSRELGP